MTLNTGWSRDCAMANPIQQPALSEQLQQLEERLGTRLFDRQPFRPTASGRRLYAETRPLFEALQGVVQDIRSRHHPEYRIVTDGTFDPRQRAALAHELHARFGGHLVLGSGNWNRIHRMLGEGEIDLGLIAAGSRKPSGLAWRPLVTLPIVLLVARAARIRSADHFWRQGTATHTLVYPQAEAVRQVFRRGLQLGGLSWPAGAILDASSLVELVAADPRRVGVSVATPWLAGHPQVRALELAGFERVQLAAVWRPRDSTRLKPLVNAIESYAHRVWCA